MELDSLMHECEAPPAQNKRISRMELLISTPEPSKNERPARVAKPLVINVSGFSVNVLPNETFAHVLTRVNEAGGNFKGFKGIELQDPVVLILDPSLVTGPVNIEGSEIEQGDARVENEGEALLQVDGVWTWMNCGVGEAKDQDYHIAFPKSNGRPGQFIPKELVRGKNTTGGQLFVGARVEFMATGSLGWVAGVVVGLTEGIVSVASVVESLNPGRVVNTVRSLKWRIRGWRCTRGEVVEVEEMRCRAGWHRQLANKIVD
jgi:hypothetical protein